VSHYSGKYVIGLTGNIATGKSVVRRMLEHLGAYSIDADALAHRAITKGAPGYKPVVDIFGRFILDAGGEIDRGKLGRMVFGDPEALKRLEAIVHPLVEQAVNVLIRRASQPVIVIEAIKLLEGKLVTACDAIWVTYAPEGIQKKRLMAKRGMSSEDAIQRIHAQESQEAKIAAANVVIQNTGSFEDTWKQVLAAWKVVAPAGEPAALPAKKAATGELSVQRGRPRDSAGIASLITRLTDGAYAPSEEDIMAFFGEMAFLLLMQDTRLVGLVGWQVENLVARTTQLYLDPAISLPQALAVMMKEMERASQDLQCEASLIFLPPDLASREDIWHGLGYTLRTARALGVQAWQDAALESQPPDTFMLFKQLRQDRVLRPI
jgi:dephospho-CoA kinase